MQLNLCNNQTLNNNLKAKLLGSEYVYNLNSIESKKMFDIDSTSFLTLHLKLIAYLSYSYNVQFKLIKVVKQLNFFKEYL